MKHENKKTWAKMLKSPVKKHIRSCRDGYGYLKNRLCNNRKTTKSNLTATRRTAISLPRPFPYTKLLTASPIISADFSKAAKTLKKPCADLPSSRLTRI